MTIRINRLFSVLAFVFSTTFSATAQHPMAPVYVGAWKGEMTVGRAVPLEISFEPMGNTIGGSAIESGKKVTFTRVIASQSGVTFRLDRDEDSFMIFVGKLGTDKLSLSGEVEVYQEKVKRGTGAWRAQKVIAPPTATTAAVVTVSARPPLAQQAYERGVPLLRNQDFNGAVAAFTECLKINPKDPGCLALRGVSYNRLEKYAEADVDLTSAIDLTPRPAASFYIERAEARTELEKFDAAIADAEAALKINSTPEAYLKRGRATARKGGFLYFDTLLLGDEKQKQAKTDGLALAAKGLADIDKFIELKPQDYRGYLQRGTYYYDLWNLFSEQPALERAIPELNKAATLAPQNAEVFYMRYTVYQSLGMQAAAAADKAKYDQLKKR